MKMISYFPNSLTQFSIVFLEILGTVKEEHNVLELTESSESQSLHTHNKTTD